jgi:hypothetical protein
MRTSEYQNIDYSPKRGRTSGITKEAAGQQKSMEKPKQQTKQCTKLAPRFLEMGREGEDAMTR